LFAHYMAFLNPGNFDFMRSVEIVVMVVLGGMGSLTGTIFAAGVLTALPEILREFAEYRLLIYSFVLVLMMIFRPQGFLGTREFSFGEFLQSPKRFLNKKKREEGDAKGGDL
ncbi:MAG TPA: branched-chain amino acid ABC transporter permease, partial [Eubacteriaceae bacterium]|nr:branched-chain amino acid ABC transporter permease [Eubacteriaceae bacterium]